MSRLRGWFVAWGRWSNRHPLLSNLTIYLPTTLLAYIATWLTGWYGPAGLNVWPWSLYLIFMLVVSTLLSEWEGDWPPTFRWRL